MNPLAWLDCGQAITEEEVTYFVSQYQKLSFAHMLHGDYMADMSECVKAVSPFSKQSWNKILNTITYISSSSTQLANFAAIGVLLILIS
jgi:hypothetical protein